jgi:hypothetical protein
LLTFRRKVVCRRRRDIFAWNEILAVARRANGCVEMSIAAAWNLPIGCAMIYCVAGELQK